MIDEFPAIHGPVARKYCKENSQLPRKDLLCRPGIHEAVADAFVKLHSSRPEVEINVNPDFNEQTHHMDYGSLKAFDKLHCSGIVNRHSPGFAVSSSSWATMAKSLSQRRYTSSLSLKYTARSRSNDLEGRLKTIFDLTQKEGSTSSKPLEDKLNEIRKNFTPSLGKNQGRVVLKSANPILLQRLEELRNELEQHQSKVRNKLQISYAQANLHPSPPPAPDAPFFD